MWGMHDGSGMGWGWGFFGMVWMLLFWGSIVALVVWVVRRLTAGSERLRLQSPLDIAKERYARREIDRQEFERLRQDLS